MATRAFVTIHLWTMGDVVMDQVVSCSENPHAYAELHNIAVNAGTDATLAIPGGSQNRFIQGVMIIPDPDNTFPFTIRNVPSDTGLKVHSTNPSFIALNAGITNPFIVTYNAPVGTNTTIRFIWV